MTRRVHAGLRHECHNEPEHAEVLAEVVDWIRGEAAGVTPPVPGVAAVATEQIAVGAGLTG